MIGMLLLSTVLATKIITTISIYCCSLRSKCFLLISLAIHPSHHRYSSFGMPPQLQWQALVFGNPQKPLGRHCCSAPQVLCSSLVQYLFLRHDIIVMAILKLSFRWMGKQQVFCSTLPNWEIFQHLAKLPRGTRKLSVSLSRKHFVVEAPNMLRC